MDRLTAQDLMMVWPEETGWSQDTGALNGVRRSLAALQVWRPVDIGSFGPATQGGRTAVSA